MENETSPPESGNALRCATGRRTQSATERARECRRRKKDKLRQIKLELFEDEISKLVQHGLLAAHERADKIAVSHALYPVIEKGLETLKGAKPSSKD